MGENIGFHRVKTLPTTGVKGHLYFVVNTKEIYIYNGSAFEKYDAGVTSKVSALDSSVSKLDGSIGTEITDRTNADADLQKSINNLTNKLNTEITTVKGLVNDETTARKTADSSLESKISANASAISAETDDRKAADTTLQNSIDSEAAARQSIDASITDALQSHIDSSNNPHNVTAAQVKALPVNDRGYVEGFQLNGSIEAWRPAAPVLYYHIDGYYNNGKSNPIITLDAAVATTDYPYNILSVKYDNNNALELGDCDDITGAIKYIDLYSTTGVRYNKKLLATEEKTSSLISAHNSAADAHSDIRTSLNGITAKIPDAATSDNMLADQAWVNSSISTNTATFRGTFETVSNLPTTNVKSNDYAFVIAVNDSGNPEYNRYKYDGSSWAFEYVLNNSSFTADQWKAINAGVTSDLVTAFKAKYDKPSGGIPASDFATDVQTILTNASTAYGWGNHANAGYAKQTDLTAETEAREAADATLTTDIIALKDIPIAKGEATGAIVANATTANATTANVASAKYSFAEGEETTAKGRAAHAEGYGTKASNDYSHAEGNGTSASNNNSHAEGMYTTASGHTSHAEGNGTSASNNNSHAEGWSTAASGSCSHAEGQLTKASGDGSHAEGVSTTASGEGSHAEGTYNYDDTTAIHIVGIGDPRTRKNAEIITYDGRQYLLNVGGYTGVARTDEMKDVATVINELQTTDSSLDSSLQAVITDVSALKDIPVRKGDGDYSLVAAEIKSIEYDGSTIIVPDKYKSVASGAGAITNGHSNTASGMASIALGFGNTASANCGTAIGNSNTASGSNSIACGLLTTASGYNSAAFGEGTTALNKQEFAVGYYNDSSAGTNSYRQIFSVGCGYDKNHTSNILSCIYDHGATGGLVYVYGVGGYNGKFSKPKVGSGGEAIYDQQDLASCIQGAYWYSITNIDELNTAKLHLYIHEATNNYSLLGTFPEGITSATPFRLEILPIGANSTFTSSRGYIEQCLTTQSDGTPVSYSRIYDCSAGTWGSWVNTSSNGGSSSSSAYNLYSVTYGVGETGTITEAAYTELRNAVISGATLYFSASGDAFAVNSANCSATISNFGTDDEYINVVIYDMYNLLTNDFGSSSETESGAQGYFHQIGSTFIIKKNGYTSTNSFICAPDNAMSSTSANAVANKVVKSYIDEKTAVDTSISSTSTNAIANSAVKAYVDDVLGDIKTVLASI